MENPESKIKTYWKLTKATLGQNKTQSIPMLIVNGISYTDDAIKASALNEFFVSQSTQVADEFVPETISVAGNGSPEINSIQIRNDQILKIMKSLNVNKACGIDGI